MASHCMYLSSTNNCGRSADDTIRLQWLNHDRIYNRGILLGTYHMESDSKSTTPPPPPFPAFFSPAQVSMNFDEPWLLQPFTLLSSIEHLIMEKGFI